MRRAVLIVALAVLAACTRAGAVRPQTGTFTIAQQREPMSLNPALENGASEMEWGLLLFQYLVKWDDRGRLVGDAAREVPTLANGGISKDGLTITYHLRKGLRFADGAPLTARDCVWSIEAILNPANDVQSRYGYDRIASAQAPNATTLVLHLKAPFAPLLTLVFAPQGFPILPAHLLARYPNFNDIPFDERPIGSGPYVVQRWVHGDRIELRANPYYWRGEPKIARLTIRFVPDPDTAIDMLRTGEIGGFFDDQDLGNYATLRALRGVYATSVPIDAVGALIFNTQRAPTNDPRVRHALAEALDVRTLIGKAYRGALSSTGAGRGLFLWAYDPRAYPDVPYDPAAANALLNRAGWRMGAGGVRSKNGTPLDVLLVLQAQTPGDAVAADMIAQEERAIGASVTLKTYVQTQFVATAGMGGPVYGGAFQMALYPFSDGDDPDATDQFSCRRIPPDGYNKSRICDREIDALLARGRVTYGEAAREVIYARLQRRLYALMPLVLLYQSREVSAFSDRLKGQSTSLSGAFWNAGAWRLGR